MRAGLAIVFLFQSKRNFVWKKINVERVAVATQQNISIALDKEEIDCVQHF